MAAQYKTPGVYIVEEDGFTNSVVEVATAIPVFIGYTEKIPPGMKGQPFKISSMNDFQTYFSANQGPAPVAPPGAPPASFVYKDTPAESGAPYAPDSSTQLFYLYYSLMLFFANEGSTCYIQAVDTYANVNSAGGAQPDDFINALAALEKNLEPTMVVIPDAMMLSQQSDMDKVILSVLQHCAKVKCRVGIFDILDGYQDLSGPNNPVDAFINGSAGSLGEDFNKYGIVYYPWINTNVVGSNAVDFSWFTNDSLTDLIAALKTEAGTLTLFNSVNDPLGNKQKNYIDNVVSLINTTPLDKTPRKNYHQYLMHLSPLYQTAMSNLRASVNLLPASGAMAGVYKRNDDTYGVQKAPAATTIVGAVSPAVAITHDQQEDLNMPINGWAVNAIRTFIGGGLQVWGARTMAGNSNDWRYINVRRSMIMLEISIGLAMLPFVFLPNVALTWLAVQSMIENFLHTQWKNGVLVGGKPSDAYSVVIGEGLTMTGDDINNGYMNVMIRVAISRPAEFIVLTFQQEMQTS